MTHSTPCVRRCLVCKPSLASNADELPVEARGADTTHLKRAGYRVSHGINSKACYLVSVGGADITNDNIWKNEPNKDETKKKKDEVSTLPDYCPGRDESWLASKLLAPLALVVNPDLLLMKFTGTYMCEKGVRVWYAKDIADAAQSYDRGLRMHRLVLVHADSRSSFDSSALRKVLEGVSPQPPVYFVSDAANCNDASLIIQPGNMGKLETVVAGLQRMK